jgi:arylsulfatase A-like enzyme
MRSKIWRIAFVPVLFLVAGCAAPPEADDGGDLIDRPNIILIMADDVGVEAFGCYGGTSYATPRLDELARTGVRFTSCYAQPLCTPSRVKLMSGRSNIHNYVHFSILDPAEPSIGEMMRQAGYATAVVGKWQLLAADHYGERAGTGTHPSDAGFDEYCLWQIDKLGSRYWNPRIDANGVVLEGLEDRYGPDVFCEYIVDFMQRKRDEPFFIYYPMALVHDPFVPTPGSADRGEEDKQKNFADMMAHMDHVIGRIIDAVDRLGLRESTLIIYTSDNGTSRAIRSNMGELVARGGKGLTTNAGTHVPLIISWPGTAADGAVCDDLVDFSDFVPTIAGAAGADPFAAELRPEGYSFLPQIMGEPGSPREWMYCYYNPRPGNKRFPERRFARDARFKLYGDGRLYDVIVDTLEEQPIDPSAESEDAAAARRKLREAIDSFPEKPVKIEQP